jgi:hypothetical protein
MCKCNATKIEYNNRTTKCLGCGQESGKVPKNPPSTYPVRTLPLSAWRKVTPNAKA